MLTISTWQRLVFFKQIKKNTIVKLLTLSKNSKVCLLARTKQKLEDYGN